MPQFAPALFEGVPPLHQIQPKPDGAQGTDRPFGGDPLVVFPEGEGLSDEEMQCLALEMNLSETTYVLAPRAPEADLGVRIFTPAKE